jgi:hypothetical protein
MTTTVHPRGAPLRIVSYGGSAQFLNPDAAGRIDNNLNVTLRGYTSGHPGSQPYTDIDGIKGYTTVVDITIPASVLIALSTRAATNHTGTAVIGGSRRGGGIVAKVRRF